MPDRPNRRVLLGAATALVLTSTNATAQITISKSFRAGQPINVTTPDQLAGVADLIQADARSPLPRGALVHIPMFRIELAKSVQKTAQTRGRGARQNSKFVLENVDDASLQAMTQALYERFVADMRAAGFKVATLQETMADPGLLKFFNNRPAPLDGPSPDGASTFYAPAGMSVNIVPGDSRMPGGMGAISAVGPMMGLASAAAARAQAGAIVLIPRYAITFVSVDSSSDHFLGGIGPTASVTGRAGIRILPEATRIEAYVPTTGSAHFYQDWFALSAPLELASADISGLRDATTRSEKQGAAVGAGLSALMALGGVGGGGSSGYNTNAVTAGPRLRESIEPRIAALQAQFVRRLGASVA